MKSLNFFFPIKQIPVLSLLLATLKRPSFWAICLTSLFNKLAIGNMHFLKANCLTCARKKVWSLCLSLGCNNLTPKSFIKYKYKIQKQIMYVYVHSWCQISLKLIQQFQSKFYTRDRQGYKKNGFYINHKVYIMEQGHTSKRVI